MKTFEEAFRAVVSVTPKGEGTPESEAAVMAHQMDRALKSEDLVLQIMNDNVVAHLMCMLGRAGRIPPTNMALEALKISFVIGVQIGMEMEKQEFPK